MQDWNVVATVREEHYDQALEFLGQFGPAAKTGFYNVVVLRVADYRRFLDDFAKKINESETTKDLVHRLSPVVATFTFHTPEEFEEKARTSAAAWIPSIAGRSFHIRMHRRGFKGKLSSMQEEQFLDNYLLEALKQYGQPGKISFDNPDAILAIETVGTQAGLSLWTREELQRYPFLKLD